MKVLIVTPSFPPYDGSHTQRMVALCNSLSNSGVSVFVLTTEIIENVPGYNPKSLESLSNKITILRCRFGFFHRRIYLKHSDLTDVKYGKQTNKKKKSNNVKSVIVHFLEKLKNFLFFPDSLCDWKRPVLHFVSKNRIIDKIKPDFIISCSMPNTVHVICSRLSRKYNIPLVMDYADPWVYISYYNHSKLRFFFEKRLETKCLKQACLVSFSTKGAEELYVEKFNLNPANTFTVVTGYDDNLVEGHGTKYEIGSNRPVTFTYGGALQPQIRFPQPFFEAVSEIEPSLIKVLIRTDDVDYIKTLLTTDIGRENVDVEPYIPFPQYYEEMLKFDILLFWGNNTSDQLPGKIFNYIPTKKVIFYISNNIKERDQTTKILNDYGNYIYVQNDKDTIKKSLLTLINDIKNANRDCPVNLESLKKYSAKNQFKQFFERLSIYMENKKI